MTFKTYHGFQELEGPLLDAEADTDSVMVSFWNNSIKKQRIILILWEAVFFLGKYKQNPNSEKEP